MSRMDQKANFVASILMRFTHCNLRLHDWQLIADNYKYDVIVPVSISLWAIVHSVATWSPNAWCLVADCGAKTCALNWGGTMYMYVHALPSAPGFSLCVEFIFVHNGRERVWCCEDKYWICHRAWYEATIFLLNICTKNLIGTSLTNFLAVNVQHSNCVCILFPFIAL